MRYSYFKIFQDRAGEWRWTLYGANQEAVATSEGYTTKYSAERSAARVKEIAAHAVIL
ncbi:YegP family protein [Candidatus Saccharibacteria bacterium]|nr:YegP family protein [Candidatus Saccharibacteria bacterium]